MKHNGERRPEEIEAEIERTRANMDATLSAIEGRLTPGELLDQGMDYLRHSGGNEFVSNLGQSVKHHPLPVTLVGLGIAWLMMAERQDRYGGGMRSHAGYASSETGIEETHGGTHEGEGATRRMSDTARQAGQRLSERAHAARDSLSNAAASARERAGRVGESGRRQYERARGSYEQLLRERPLALGAIGVAVGAMVAAAIPRTRREDELMGETRDRLAEKAKETGSEQLRKAEHVVEKGRQASADEAQRQQAPGTTGASTAAEPRRPETAGPAAATPSTTQAPGSIATPSASELPPGATRRAT